MNILKKKQPLIDSNPRQFDESGLSAPDRLTAYIVKLNRAYLIQLILVVAVLVLASSIRFMLPLEKTVPFSVQQNINGEYVADFSAFQNYKPTDAVVESQSRNLAKYLYSILSYKDAVDNLEKAKSYMVGNAILQFSEWFNLEKPTLKVKDDPDYTRTVEITSSSMLPNDVVIVRFKTTSSSKTESSSNKYILTAKYIIAAPKTREEALENPTGIFYEHFTIDVEK